MKALAVAAFAGLAMGGAAGRAAEAPRRPNILFILADDHAAQAVSAYGSRINRTPQIDRLAREGARFENCFAVNSICVPSRASILTGLYSHANGVRTNGDPLPPGSVTFPLLLHNAGYTTALFGKWHLQTAPEGFDHWCILPGQGVYQDPPMIENGRRRASKGYVSDVIAGEALAWLKARDKGKPFCLLVHHKAPHADWEASERHKAMFEGADVPEPETFGDDMQGRSEAARSHRLFVGPKLWELHYEKRFGPIPGDVPEAGRKRWVYERFIKDYLRCVASVDDGVGQLLEELAAQDVARDTVVVYTSDQGFFLGEHGLYDKRLMYEESIRMPLLVRWPAVIAPGARIGAMVLNVDFAPTLLELGGAEAPKGLHGRSVAPWLRGEHPPDWRDAFYYRYYEEAFGLVPIEGVRTAHQKLIRYLGASGGTELFDLDADPHELRNLAGAPASAPVEQDLQRTLARLRDGLGIPSTETRP